VKETTMTDITWTDTTYPYVACCYGADSDEPGDCYTRVGRSYRLDVDSLDGETDYLSEKDAREAALAAVTTAWWYDDGDDDCRCDTYGPYDSEEEAREAACSAASENDESAAGEDADAMRDRLLTERAGYPDPGGEYCVYWETVGDDAHVVARYATEEAAEAAATLADEALRARHSGHLLCGYGVRQIVAGDWVRDPTQY
jgi:hypothetical protein